jgi:hypothetical protein
VELQARGNAIFNISNYVSAITVHLAAIVIQEIVTKISTAVVAQWSLGLLWVIDEAMSTLWFNESNGWKRYCSFHSYFISTDFPRPV